MPRREREQVARDLKPIYTALDADAAHAALEAFDEQWGQRFPVITQAWLNAWEHVTPFLAFPEQVRRVIYTTNAIEALNRQLRKALKTKGHFPNEDAARKLIYLAIHNAVPAWTKTRNWTTRSWRSRSTSATGSPTPTDTHTDIITVNAHTENLTPSIRRAKMRFARRRPHERLGEPRNRAGVPPGNCSGRRGSWRCVSRIRLFCREGCIRGGCRGCCAAAEL